VTQWLDLLERSAWTAVQTFSASVVLTGGLGWGDVKIAAGAAVLAVLKNLSIVSTVRGQLEVLSSLTKPKTKRRGGDA
jgi:hypothetical protein